MRPGTLEHLYVDHLEAGSPRPSHYPRRLCHCKLSLVSRYSLRRLFLPQLTKLLLDNLEDLLLIELLGKSLDGCQSLTTIALLNANVDVVLGLLRFPSVVVGLREGVCQMKRVSRESPRAMSQPDREAGRKTTR